MGFLRSSAAVLLVVLCAGSARAESSFINSARLERPSLLIAREHAPRKRVVTWIVGGMGLGFLGGAIGTTAAASLYEAPRDLTMSGLVPGGARSQLVVATDVLWSLGAVAEGVATAMYFLEGRSKKPRAPADLVPIFLPSGAGFALSAKFH
jgi:hypothetical protein